MRRAVILLVCAVFCIGAVSCGLSRPAARRQVLGNAGLAPKRLLILDAATRAIFAGADRVETFRLADFREEKSLDRIPARQAALDSYLGSLDGHTVLRAGVPQGKQFAAALNVSLSNLKDFSATRDCLFDPVVGFRVWKGKAHTDLCICFLCSGVEIITRDAAHKEVFRKQTELDEARAAFLALARQAFPQDAPLSALKD